MKPLARERSNARAQEERNLAALQARANADQDRPHAAFDDHTRLQLLLDAECRKLQSVERTISGFAG